MIPLQATFLFETVSTIVGVLLLFVSVDRALLDTREQHATAPPAARSTLLALFAAARSVPGTCFVIYRFLLYFPASDWGDVSQREM